MAHSRWRGTQHNCCWRLPATKRRATATGTLDAKSCGPALFGWAAHQSLCAWLQCVTILSMCPRGQRKEALCDTASVACACLQREPLTDHCSQREWNRAGLPALSGYSVSQKNRAAKSLGNRQGS